MLTLSFKFFILYLLLPLINGILTQSGKHSLQSSLLDPTSQTCSSGDFEIDETTKTGMIVENAADTCDDPRMMNSEPESSQALAPKDSSSEGDEVTTTNPKQTGVHFLSLQSKEAKIFFLILCAIVVLPFLFGLWDRLCVRRSNREETPSLNYSLANISGITDTGTFGNRLVARTTQLMARLMNWVVFRDFIPRTIGNQSLDISFNFMNSNLSLPRPTRRSLLQKRDKGSSSIPPQFEQ